uniref:NDUC2 dehydrogenase n=1 Tax=Junco hyemalis TaxID=40217 RepID=A0A8C5JGC4_JUNHY
MAAVGTAGTLAGAKQGERSECLGAWEKRESWGQFLSPPAAAGIHRQVLLATLGCVVGYHLVKRTEYVHAKVDRELCEYIKHHPEDFRRSTGKKRIGQLLEDFQPVR